MNATHACAHCGRPNRAYIRGLRYCSYECYAAGSSDSRRRDQESRRRRQAADSAARAAYAASPFFPSGSWTVAEVRVLRQLYGHRPAKVVAKYLKRTPTAVHAMAKRLREHGHSVPHPPRPTKPIKPKGTRRSARRLYLRGVNTSEIARRLGIHPSTVEAWAGKYDWRQRDDLVGTPVVAEILGLSVATINRYIEKGWLGCYVGYVGDRARRYAVSAAQIEAFLADPLNVLLWRTQDLPRGHWREVAARVRPAYTSVPDEAKRRGCDVARISRYCSAGKIAGVIRVRGGGSRGRYAIPTNEGGRECRTLRSA